MSHCRLFEFDRCAFRFLHYLMFSFVLLGMTRATFAQALKVVNEGNGTRTPFELNEKYLRLLRTSNWETIGRLKEDVDLGTALQAAWEHVRRTLPIERPESERSTLPRMERASVQRFLGFAEGRLGVSPPQWWQRSLLDGRGHCLITGTQKYNFGNGKAGIYFEQSAGDSADTVVNTPGNVKVLEFGNGQLSVVVDNTPIKIELKDQVSWGLNVQRVEGTRFVAAFPNILSATCDILAIDTTTDTPIWRSTIWGEVPQDVRQGPGWFHWVDFRIHKDNVIVFGLMNDVVYIEGFGTSTGESAFRFSSSYCTPLDKR